MLRFSWPRRRILRILKDTYEWFSWYDTSYTWHRSTNETCKRTAPPPSLLAFDIPCRSTSDRIRRRLATCRCTVDRVYRGFQASDSSRKSLATAQNKQDLWLLEIYDLRDMASGWTCIWMLDKYYAERERERRKDIKFIICEIPLLSLHCSSLPVLFTISAAISMHRIRLPQVSLDIWIWTSWHIVIVVFAILSRHLCVVAVPQTIAHLNSRSAIKALLERVADHTKVGQSHPACLHRAGARHAMAFALFTHLRLNVLHEKGKREERS